MMRHIIFQTMCNTAGKNICLNRTGHDGDCVLVANALDSDLLHTVAHYLVGYRQHSIPLHCHNHSTAAAVQHGELQHQPVVSRMQCAQICLNLPCRLANNTHSSYIALKAEVADQPAVLHPSMSLAVAAKGFPLFQ